MINALPDIWFEFLVLSRKGATTWQTRRSTKNQANNRWLRAKCNQDEHQPVTLWSNYLGRWGFKSTRNESKARAGRQFAQEITRFKHVRSNRLEPFPLNHVIWRPNRTARKAREINKALTLIFTDLSRLLFNQHEIIQVRGPKIRLWVLNLIKRCALPLNALVVGAAWLMRKYPHLNI